MDKELVWTQSMRKLERCGSQTMRGNTGSKLSVEYVLPQDGLVRLDVLIEIAKEHGVDGTREEWLHVLLNSGREVKKDPQNKDEVGYSVPRYFIGKM